MSGHSGIMAPERPKRQALPRLREQESVVAVGRLPLGGFSCGAGEPVRRGSVIRQDQNKRRSVSSWLTKLSD